MSDEKLDRGDIWGSKESHLVSRTEYGNGIMMLMFVCRVIECPACSCRPLVLLDGVK